RRRRSPVAPLALSTILGFLLFCTLLKWQLWGNRLLLPFYILNAPVVGSSLAALSSPLTAYGYAVFSRVRVAIIGLLTTIALLYSFIPLYTFLMALQPPIGLDSVWGNARLALYFRGAGPLLATPYHAVVQQAAVHHCATIGLNVGSNDWEYPLWVLMASFLSTPRIKHVQVNNLSRFLPEEFPNHQLCGIFKIRGIASEYSQP
ncbi:MAG: hypothetical protein NZ772_13895, partial [Cyanobacteria bacterium]|nr:hypothetical protein [Cyanobacteriota bacterium]MDW8202469.1 hypothetical protein [Cyanobacteriota bacterium SKYGB_h_bin112]